MAKMLRCDSPPGWGLLKLGQIAEINKESRDPVRELPNKELMYIDIDSVENETGIIKVPHHVLGKDAPSRARRVVHTDDIIMSSVRPYLKAFALIPEKYDNQICSTGFAVLTCLRHVVPLYLLYALFSKRTIEQCKRMMSGGQYPALNTAQIAAITVLCPPLTEQTRIAEVLGTVDEAIERVDEAIEKAERLKRGLMQHLLTEGIGQKEFKGTEIGRIPGSWSLIRLGDIGILQYGFTASATKEDTGTRFLRITDIQDNWIDWALVPYCETAKSDLEKHGLRKGDLLFARIGSTTGKTAYISESVPAVFASYLIRFRPSRDDIDTRFLFYYTHSRLYWLQVNRNKEAQLKKGLNAGVLGNLLVPFPPLAEQRLIAEILEANDLVIRVQRAKRDKLVRMKTGLMQELLTGKRRVEV